METPDEPFQAIFASHVDTVYRALDLLYPAIHAAVDALCATMLDERRVLVCGSGTGTATFGQYIEPVRLGGRRRLRVRHGQQRRPVPRGRPRRVGVHL